MVQADGTLRLELIFLYSASGGGCNGQWMMSDAIRWYDQNISEVSRRYESVAANTVHGWLDDLLPNAPALVLDIGAGTGRDAAWLASRGLEVIAVDPSIVPLTATLIESRLLRLDGAANCHS